MNLIQKMISFISKRKKKVHFDEKLQIREYNLESSELQEKSNHWREICYNIQPQSVYPFLRSRYNSCFYFDLENYYSKEIDEKSKYYKYFFITCIGCVVGAYFLI